MSMETKGLRTCSAPGSWAIHHDPEYTQHLMTTPTGHEERLPQVIMTTEAKDYDAKKMLASFPKELRDDWDGYQVTRNAGTMGIAAFVHRSVKVLDWGITLGVTPFILNRRVRMEKRYPMWMHVSTDGHSYFPIGCHNAPTRFKALQKPYLNHVHALAAGHPHAIPMGDWNHPFREVRIDLDMNWAAGMGIVSIMGREATSGHDVDLSRWGINNKVADHLSTSVTVKPRVHRKPK